MKVKPRAQFCVRYRHYRTGKIMDARKYGYKAWSFLRKRK
jgi:hypothetical protein